MLQSIFKIFLILSCSLSAYELGIVTMFRNEALYLKEWIEYHQMIGVDHFLLYNDRSEDNWNEVLEPYINSGLVEVIEWSAAPGTAIFPGWQVDAYKDGIVRSLGNTKWLAFIDVDEFILPKKHATVLECLDKMYFLASGVFICWRNFGTNNVYIRPGKPILTELTRASHPLHSRNASGKSIVKVDAVNIQQTWSPHQLVLKEGEQYYNASLRPLYFDGSNLVIDPKHTSDFLQINHYTMRDEGYYRRVRLPKAISNEYGDLSLLEEHYKAFNYQDDYEMVNFLKKKHNKMYRKFWRR